MHQAIELGIKHRHKAVDQPIGEILARFLTNRQTIRNNRTRTIDEYRCQLGKFAKDFADRPVATITAIEIEQWLVAPHLDNRGRKRTWSGGRRNVTRGYIATLFNFGLRKNMCSTNPAQGVDKAIIDRRPIEIWTAEEAVLILRAAAQECPELLRFLVLAFFSGIRTCELFLLQSEHIKLDQGVIAVPASMSKTRKVRNVPISANLAAWLMTPTVHKLSGGIWSMGESSLHRRYRLLEKTTGLKWRGNALRHTYASNHIAVHDNEYLTSRACGHTPRMLREHYDAVVSKAHGQAHFAIFPSGIVD
jgi:integrase